ncbi:hypothetical protein [Labilithrix luteola]|nr:hypothetical protein [Labilithrix luteola]
MNEQNSAWPFFPWSTLAADLVTDMATLLALPTNTAAEIDGVGALAASADAPGPSELVASAKRAMESLAKSDPEAAARIAREYALIDSNGR